MSSSTRIISAIAGFFLTGAALAITPFELTPVQKNIISSLLLNDAKVFLSGGKSHSSYSIDAQVVDIADISKTYDENQVAGDLAYFDKKLVVLGTIESINSGIGNSPYVVFKSKKFMKPQAHFSKDLITEIATLRKGQEVILFCIGGGAVAGSPMLKRCQSTSSLASSMADDKQKEVQSFLSGAETDKTISYTVAFSIAGSSLLPEQNKCSTANEKCAEQVLSVVSSKKNKPKIQGAVDDARRAMIEAGLKVHLPENKTKAKS